jgi:hypothetical protein
MNPGLPACIYTIHFNKKFKVLLFGATNTLPDFSYSSIPYSGSLGSSSTPCDPGIHNATIAKATSRGGSSQMPPVETLTRYFVLPGQFCLGQAKLLADPVTLPSIHSLDTM